MPLALRLARVSLLLPVLALLLPAAHAILCRRSADCADNRRCTIDYCEPTKNKCYAFPRPGAPCDAPATFHTLATLRAAVSALSAAERLVIVNAAVNVLRDVHPHRDMHLALRGVDPVPGLLIHARQLRADVAAKRLPSEPTFDFHQRMISAFNSLNDLHTTYRAPVPLKWGLAMLPFSLRHYYVTDAAGKRELRYVVTDVANGILIGNPAFAVGVRILSYNYVDIDDAVRRSGAVGVGANDAARISRGSRRLTRRFLRRQLAPDREFATIGFLSPTGSLQYVNLRWNIANFSEPQSNPLEDVATSGAAVYARVFERATDGILPKLADMSDKMPRLSASAEDARPPRMQVAVKKEVSSHLSGEVVDTKFGKLGIIKIYDFNSFLFFDFLEEVLRLLLAMKDHAVVIDVRGNNGGIVYLAQMSIQFFTAKVVKPMLWSTRITETTARLENAISVPGQNMSAKSATTFTETIKYGFRAGDQFSGSLSLVSERSFSGRRYTREMFVLTDAETYSAGDLFAAAVQDNEAAFVVGEDETTGAGGSSLLVYSSYLKTRCPDIFPQLPGGVDFVLAFRRMNRVGAYAGIAVEHFGITPDKRYYPTMRDRTQGDVDLHHFLAEFISRRHNASKPTASPSVAIPPVTVSSVAMSTPAVDPQPGLLPSQEP